MSFKQLPAKDEDDCRTQCVFRNDDQCHYSAFETDQCFLGDMNHVVNNATCSGGSKLVSLMKGIEGKV